jgi:hypothetical protein
MTMLKMLSYGAGNLSFITQPSNNNKKSFYIICTLWKNEYQIFFVKNYKIDLPQTTLMIIEWLLTIFCMYFVKDHSKILHIQVQFVFAHTVVSKKNDLVIFQWGYV